MTGRRYVHAEGHAGTLRFVRAANILHFLAAETGNDEYFELGTITFGTEPIGLLRLEACTDGASDSVDIVWKDLVIRAEEFKYVSVPVTRNGE